MATFGNTNTAVTYILALKDYKYACKYTLSESANVTKLSAYVENDGSEQVIKGVIYDDDGGAPGDLLGVTAETNVTGTDPYWEDFTFAAPVSLTAGDYWLGLIFGNTTQSTSIFEQQIGGSGELGPDTYSDGPSDPYGYSVSYSPRTLCIYATYPDSITASGALQVGNITVSGAATRTAPVGWLSWPLRWLGVLPHYEATGALEISSVTVAGTAKVSIKGSGALQVSSVTMQGRALHGVVYGDGALQIGSVTVSGAAKVSIKGSGALEIGSISFSGDALKHGTFPGPIGAGEVFTQPVSGDVFSQPVSGDVVSQPVSGEVKTR